MTARLPLRLTFWGVRGSIPTPSAGTLGFGGNTACLEIRYGNELRLIVDAGSGVRPLGLALHQECGGRPETAHLFLSHFHWDHILGLPFFVPLYLPNWSLTFYSTCPASELEARMATPMRAPHFPAEAAVRARREYRQVNSPGARLGDVVVTAFPVNHPGGSTAYRIDAPQASIVYATDHEHGDPAADSLLRQRARGADVLVCDAQYTPEEYKSKKGWGHSTWAEAAVIARDAGVKQLVLFHHDPDHDDDEVSRIVNQARAEFPNTAGAREGWSLEL